MAEENQRLSVRYMMAELDHAVAEGGRATVILAFVDALEPLYDFVLAAGGPHRGDGERAFAMFHLATRSVNDLMASAHLASHGYLQQAYGTMRPVHENCDLMELFAREPAEAGLWVNSEMPGKDYRPSKVRARLGSHSAEEHEYGHFSEMGSHPRFAGSRLTGLMKVSREHPKDRRLVLRVGSFYRDHPSNVYIYLWLFQMVVRLGHKLRHLGTVSDKATRDIWSATYLESARAVKRGLEAVEAELMELGIPAEDTEGIGALYDKLIDTLAPAG